MKILTYVLPYLILCLSLEVQSIEHKVRKIEKYKIEIPKELTSISAGFFPGIGSGLAFVKKHQDGTLEFKGITDRGPNFPMEGGGAVCFDPSFVPKIITIMVTPEKIAKVTAFKDVRYQGKYVVLGDPNENLVDPYIQKVNPPFKIDPEAIAILDQSKLVIGDEYLPSLIIVDDKTGNILEILSPGKGLPEIFKFRRFNRGFEAVSAHGSKIYAAMEGTLDIDGATAKTAKFIRILELDVNTKKTKMYAYQFDYDAYTDGSKVKIGDLAVIEDGVLLMIEQGTTKNNELRHIIYKVDLRNATDISEHTLSNGKPLEFAQLNDLKLVNFPTKELIFNARAYGWEDQNIEGLAVIDNHRIAITNDNNFGIVGYTFEPCSVGSDKKCKRISPKIDINKQKTSLWIVHF